MDLKEIIPSLISMFTGLAGSGPWGIGAMLLSMGALGGTAFYLIKRFNKSVDAADDANAGADAGKTAQDLKNQADDNRHWLKKKIEEWKSGKPDE